MYLNPFLFVKFWYYDVLFLQSAIALASLDSTFIDVYKGANCVIFMFDITSKWWVVDFLLFKLFKVIFA